jgi:hypothetical protein
VPIKSFLDTSGPNTLTISIAPAYNTTLEAQASYPYFIPTLYVSTAAQHGLCAELQQQEQYIILQEQQQDSKCTAVV